MKSPANLTKSSKNFDRSIHSRPYFDQYYFKKIMQTISTCGLRLFTHSSSSKNHILRRLLAQNGGGGGGGSTTTKSSLSLTTTMTSAAKTRLRAYRVSRPKQRAGANSRSVEGLNVAEAAELKVRQIERGGWQMWKPTLFAVGFGGCCFTGAAIWEYEYKRHQADSLFNPKRWSFENHRQKAGDLRRQLNTWWNARTRGEKVFFTIAGLNGLVFLGWKIPFLKRTMIRYFTSSFYGEKLCLPMVLSTFSHYSLLHLGVNMYVLWSFSGNLMDHMMGAEHYVAFYLTAGVMASLAGFAHRALFRLPTYALGASGAILGILTYTCTRVPDAQLSIIFLPMFTFSAQSALVGIIAFDSLGLLLRWKLFDHAAHLGGSLLGIWYGYYGEKWIWGQRHKIVEEYKEITGR